MSKILTGILRGLFLGIVIGATIALMFSVANAAEQKIGYRSFTLTTDLFCSNLNEVDTIKCYATKEKCLEVTRNYSVSGCVNFYPKESK